MGKDEKMKKFTGICKYCGTEYTVIAESQNDANDMASEQCACGGNKVAEKKKMMKENIDQLLGTECEALGFRPVDREIIAVIEQLGCMAIDGRIQNVAIKVDGTVINIKAGEKTKIKRKYTYEQEGQVE